MKNLFVKGSVSAILALIVSAAAFFGLYGLKKNQNEIIENQKDFAESVLFSQGENDEPQFGNLGGDGTTFTGGTTYYLSGSGISSSATSIGLTSFTVPQSGYELLTADVAGASGSVYLTIEPGNRTRQEFVSCTTITQSASDTTATLSGCTRGLSPIAPYTTSASYKFAHAGGSAIIISNSPAFYDNFAVKNNDEAITGYWTVPDPTSAQGVASKSYVDGTAFGGVGLSSETATGTVEIATGVEIASSTTNGTIGRLAIPASLATSTYNSATADLKVVVTQNDGKIDSNFVATSTLSIFPTGSVMAYATTTAPDGWLLANGTAVSRTTYASLFSVLGVSYGVGDGSTTFNLPNITGRNIIMASSTQSSVDTLGEIGGEFTHTLTTAEMPAHTHTAAGSVAGVGGNFANSTNPHGELSVASGSTGGGGSHNVLDPYIVLQYIIKY